MNTFCLTCSGVYISLKNDFMMQQKKKNKKKNMLLFICFINTCGVMPQWGWCDTVLRAKLKSCRSWAEFWEIQISICEEMCKKLLVLTKSCQSQTDGPALVSNTGVILTTYCQYWFDSGWHWLIMTFFYTVFYSYNADIKKYNFPSHS